MELQSSTTLVKSNCPDVIEWLLCLYPTATLLPVSGLPTSAPHFEIEARRTANGQAYTVRAVDGNVYRFRDLRQALANLESLINAAAAEEQSDHLLLHAGAVALGGDGVLIPAVSGAGKSTLVASLCLSGFRYLSDDIAVVDLDSLRVRSFLKSICLKDGGWQVVSSRFGESAKVLDGVRFGDEEVHYLRAPQRVSPQDSVAIRYIVIPKRQTGVRAELEPISRARVLVELAEHSMNLPKHGIVGFDALARMVESVKCFTLSYAEAQDGVVVIRELLGRRRAECDTPLLAEDPSIVLTEKTKTHSMVGDEVRG